MSFFSSRADYSKLKTNLRLTVNRLKLLEKKKTEIALKSRKEIADFISASKEDRARIRVEQIIREDYVVEAMELIEMYCDLLLARFGLIQTQNTLDPGLEEAVATLIWVAPRMQMDVQELKVIHDQLTYKYSKEFAEACRANRLANVSEKVMHRLSVLAPPKDLVERYMVEIARSYNIPFEPDSCALGDDDDLPPPPGGKGGGGGQGDLINFDLSDKQPAPAIYFPAQFPGQGTFPGGNTDSAYPPGAGQGTYPPGQGTYPPGPGQNTYPPSSGQNTYPPGPGQNTYPPGPEKGSYPPGPDHSTYPGSGSGGSYPPGPGMNSGATGGQGGFVNPGLSLPNQPPPYEPVNSHPADARGTPGYPPGSITLPPPSAPDREASLHLPDLPDLPPGVGSTAPSGSSRSDDVNFDDLARRFEQLKHRK